MPPRTSFGAALPWIFASIFGTIIATFVFLAYTSPEALNDIVCNMNENSAQLGTGCLDAPSTLSP